MSFQHFFNNSLSVKSLLVLLVICLGVTLGPFLSNYEPDVTNASNDLQPPSLTHVFGTDDMGRDVFVRILYGGRSSLLIGVIATLVSLIIGITIGSLCGYYGGFLDRILMRLTDLFLGLPSLFIILVVNMLIRDSKISFLRTGILPVSLTIGFLSWMELARLVRANYFSLREKDFVVGVRALGASEFRIASHYILPSTLSSIVVNATLLLSGSILTESGLSFLGFGVQPPIPTWGNMLNRAQTYFYSSPWLGIFPGLMICITVISINLFGDGLNDAFNPRRYNYRRKP